MTLTVRRYLYIVFILAFATITPLLILYANGYQLSLNKRGFVKTGMFILDSNPRGALVYVNGQKQAAIFDRLLGKQDAALTTPAKIKNMEPGEYDVKIELDGYWPWQKKLSIYPGASTYAEDIILFKKELPLLLVQDAFASVSYSPDGRFAAGSARGWQLVSLSDGAAVKLPADPKARTAGWSADSKKLLIGKTLISADDPKNYSDLSKLIGDDRIDLKFDAAADNLIYCRTEDQLLVFDSLNREIKPILTGLGAGKNYKIIDYLVKERQIYLIADLGAKMVLDIYERNGEKRGSLDLPKSAGYRFVSQEHRLINLYDAVRGRLFLIDPLSPVKRVSEIIEPIKNFKWLSDSQLFYSDDFEVTLFDIGNKQKRLIARLGNVIRQIFWHPSDNYVLYSTDNSINIIELDERVKQNVTELISLAKIGNLRLSEDGKSLFFTASIGQADGFYQMNLQ